MLQTKSADGTFTPNKKAPIHRWFPYLEGYSAELVRNILSTAGDVKTVYDPFAGTGTTAVVATQSGISALYSEINPFMRLVTEAKTTCVSALCASGEREKRIVQLADDVRHLQPDQAGTAPCWGDFAKYFDPEVLLRIRQLQHLISGIESSAARTIATVLLGAILVPVSRMKRQGDLRFARAGEKKESDRDVIGIYLRKLYEAACDLHEAKSGTSDAALLSADARDMHTDTRVDCIVTSPPYLNGTNYIRNTKLELKLGHFIETRQDLAKLHSAGIVAGINNVHVSAQSWKMPKDIQQTVAALEDCAYDRRIPRMVEYYFRDMDMVLERLSHVLRLGGCLFLDVGDSQFAGIHVPTHSYLTCLGALHGLQLTDEFEIRARRSKNGMKLTQRLLQFRKVRRP